MGEDGFTFKKDKKRRREISQKVIWERFYLLWLLDVIQTEHELCCIWCFCKNKCKKKDIRQLYMTTHPGQITEKGEESEKKSSCFILAKLKIERDTFEEILKNQESYIFQVFFGWVQEVFYWYILRNGVNGQERNIITKPRHYKKTFSSQIKKVIYIFSKSII